MRSRANYLLLVVLLVFIPLIFGSSHSEAPETSVSPTNDATDFYFFRSYENGRSDFVTFIANYYPFQNPYGGPNYFALNADSAYEIALDLNGDAIEDFVYRFLVGYDLGGSNGDGITLNVGGVDVAVPLKFVGPITGPTDPNLNFVEYYRLYEVTASQTVAATNPSTGTDKFFKPFDNAGKKTFPDYDAYVKQFYYDVQFSTCAANVSGKVFVGQRKESFSVNLGGIFDLVDFIPIDRNLAPVFTTGVVDDPSNNILRYASVTSFILEVPISCFPSVSSNNNVIGAWTRTKTVVHNPDGSHSVGNQIQRLGNPLVNELVIGLPDKDTWNTQNPVNEVQYASYVLYPSFPAILDLLLRADVNKALGTQLTNLAPATPRNDLVAVFLTGLAGINQPVNPTPGDMLRLNVDVAPVAASAQNRLGVIAGDVAGYPNGRRPGDDVVDIAIRVVMGVLYHANLNLGSPADAPVGTAPFSDGAPIDASYFHSVFPYLTTPRPGSYYQNY